MIRYMHNCLGALLLSTIALLLLSCDGKPLTPDPESLSMMITSVTPESVVVGSEVTIEGVEFGTLPASVKVYFGDVEAQVGSISSTRIVVVVPEGVKPGKTGIRVVKQGNNSESVDSVMILASPFTHQRGVVTISGINLELEQHTLKKDQPDSIYLKTVGVDIHAILLATNCSSMSREMCCQESNVNNTINLNCNSDKGTSPYYPTHTSYRLSVVVDTANRQLTHVYYYYGYTDSHGGTIYDIDSVRFQNIPYSVNAVGDMTAELRGSGILDHLIALKLRGGNISIYKTGATSESVRVTEIKPDALVRIVLMR